MDAINASFFFCLYFKGPPRLQKSDFSIVLKARARNTILKSDFSMNRKILVSDLGIVWGWGVIKTIK